MRILFLGETYRADAQSWIRGVEENFNQKLETMELPRGDSRILRFLASFIFLLRILSTHFSKPYDLVLSERATSYGFFSLFVNGKKKVVAQQGITDVYPEYGFSKFYKSILQRTVYKRVDLIHAWGNVMTYAMLESGAKPVKIMVLPKGINTHKFIASNKEGLPPCFIVTRSLYALYRHIDIVEAVKILKDQNQEVKVFFIGIGPEMADVQSKIKKYGLEENIFLKGYVPNDELPNLLESCRYYIAVPTTEGVSSSLFEAMAAGCFPIVTDLPANQNFIKDKKNGLLVPVCNPEKLAEAMQWALEQTEKVTFAISSNREFIEQFVDFRSNMKVITDRYKKLIQFN